MTVSKAGKVFGVGFPLSTQKPETQQQMKGREEEIQEKFEFPQIVDIRGRRTP
jgi:hypothetical protein